MLIPRKTLQRHARGANLEQQAQQHARQLLREAQQQAEQIRKLAYKDGYQQGMLDAMNQIGTFLADSQTLAINLRDSLHQHARQLLTHAVEHPETLLLLLEECLRNLPVVDTTLYLILPRSMRRQNTQFSDVLAAHWPHPYQLDFHTDAGFVLRYADQVIEFSPEQYTETASRALINTLASLPEECRQLSQQALQAFITQWHVTTPSAESEQPT
ncbi:oxygen-regulated invasion protein OrgB [Aeromonas cavernicola]|uniref:oxygen-regulated invasion protein OrgB n=1 Tax=Aeromonas cavernicola TaxID=1006623 RepID=UPI0012FE55D4|nr:oxygen-regulated invasion protein OrgB [Aeromonas cavernicola]